MREIWRSCRSLLENLIGFAGVSGVSDVKSRVCLDELEWMSTVSIEP